MRPLNPTFSDTIGICNRTPAGDIRRYKVGRLVPSVNFSEKRIDNLHSKVYNHGKVR